MSKDTDSSSSRKDRLARVIFKTDTPWAKAFDVFLLLAILFSVFLVVLESYQAVREAYETFFFYSEWGITALFTVEYLTRLYLAKRPLRYALSFFGIIDLLAVLPSYLELFLVGPHYLMVIRALRLLRLFRILKITRFIKAENTIRRALKASRPKIVVFLVSILLIMLVIGASMYLIEGPEHGFENIPLGVYWALNTLTPVSGGTLVAQTVLGRILAAILMFLGYALLAIPTGIISSEITRAALEQQKQDRICPSCGRSGHEKEATHCKFCGAKLDIGSKGEEGPSS